MRRSSILISLALAGAALGQNGDCPFNPRVSAPAPALVFREISRRSEALAAERLQVVSTRRRAVVSPPLKANNFIDDEIFAKMKRDGIQWTALSSDQEFLRRVTIDLTGEIPSPETVKAFLADVSNSKREKLVEHLLDSDAFNDRWTMWFGDLVQNVVRSSTATEYIQARQPFATYIRQSFASHKPYDRMVREIITGTGSSFRNGTPAYYVRQVPTNAGSIPQDVYDNLSTATGDQFLGMPLLCVSCHNGLGHLELVNKALSRRTRLDLWKNAAFFAQTFRQLTPNSLTGAPETILSDTPTGEYQLNTTSGNKSPRYPLGDGQDTIAPAFFLTGETPRSNETRREAYARMLTAHPQFARNAVNLLWKELFGLGIVEPVNAFDLSRQDEVTLPAGQTLQPTHPQLLTKLANAFIASGYDVRSILRLMVESNAYQLTSAYTPGPWDEQWVPYFARHYARRVMAEALFDAIIQATGVPASLREGPDETPPPLIVPLLKSYPKAMQLPDPLTIGDYAPFLDRLGRGNRDNLPRTPNPSIGQALSLLNSKIIIERVKSSAQGSTVQTIIATESDAGAMTDRLFLITLCRYPTSAERNAAVSYLSGGPVAQRLEDLQFALINSLEFLFN